MRQWADENPEADAQAMLRWGEDLHTSDRFAMTEGTLHKIGQAVVGDSYGVRVADPIRCPNPLPPRRVRVELTTPPTSWSLPHPEQWDTVE